MGYIYTNKGALALAIYNNNKINKMSKEKTKYQIVKTMTDKNTGKKTFVLLNNGVSEIFETSKKEKAEKLAEMYNINSDSGHVYTVRKVGL